jgi:SAM-dependent methyltransferase
MENEEILKKLSEEYGRRFSGKEAERIRVWKVLIHSFFQDLIGTDQTILDLGCGYGEFINQVDARKKFGMDLNPSSKQFLAKDVNFLFQDCSHTWQLAYGSLDIVFTSNFFEHLPNKASLSKTLDQAFRCLRPGGRIICMGPNIRYLPGAYWDFWDHFVPLTDLSLGEALELHRFDVVRRIPRFLPYTMSDKMPPADFFIRCYLSMSALWWVKGRQFLVIGRKP